MNLFGIPERRAIGVDVGGKSIKAVQMSHGPRGWRVEATASFARATPNASLDKLEVRRLADVLRRRSFHGDQIVLAAPSDKLVTGAMELPPRTMGPAFHAVARAEFTRAFKCDLATAEMAYWDLPAPARAAKTTHVMATACPHTDADALIDLCATAGLDVVGLDMRCWAMARACEPLAQDARGIVILLEIGWNSAVLVVLHAGVVIYERAVIEAGIRHLETTIQEALRIAPQVTEQVLCGSGLLVDKAHATDDGSGIPLDLLADVRAAIAAHFDTVAQELMASVSYTSHQYPDAPVSRLLLLGGGAMIPGVAEHMKGAVGFECRVVTPLAGATCAAGVARECDASVTTAAGLAQFNEW